MAFDKVILLLQLAYMKLDIIDLAFVKSLNPDLE